MTAKTPTPQGVSALLKRAGFQRGKRVIRGTVIGYEVSRDYGTGAVRVEHVSFSMNPADAVTAGALAKYAEAVTAAGYAVITPSPRYFLVSAQEED